MENITDEKKTRRNFYITRRRRDCICSKKDGSRGRLVSQSQYAKDLETVQDEDEMINTDAVKMRRKYPALGKAWKHYKTVWHLIMSEKDR